MKLTEIKQKEYQKKNKFIKKLIFRTHLK